MNVVPGHLDLPGDPVAAALFCLAATAPPGDPDAVRTTARAFARLADLLRDALRELAGLARDTSTWTGAAADAFRGAVGAPGTLPLHEVPDRYTGYARVLNRYADDLDHTRVAWPAARSRVEDALHELQMVQAASAGVPAVVDCARQQCGAASRGFAEVFDAWADSSTRCVRGLRAVDADDHLHNPHGWHAVVDTASTALGDVSTITGVLGILALAICPPAAAALLAVSAASSGLALAGDLDRKYAYDEDVSLTTLASDALGVLPMGAAAQATKAGVGTARATATVSRAVPTTAALGRTAAPSAPSASRAAAAAFTAEWKQSMITAPRAAVSAMRSGRLAITQPELGPTLSHFRRNADAPAGFAASAGINAYENRHEGVARAVIRSPFRVMWKPIGDAAPAGPVRVATEAVAPPIAILEAFGSP